MNTTAAGTRNRRVATSVIRWIFFLTSSFYSLAREGDTISKPPQSYYACQQIDIFLAWPLIIITSAAAASPGAFRNRLGKCRFICGFSNRRLLSQHLLPSDRPLSPEYSKRTDFKIQGVPWGLYAIISTMPVESIKYSGGLFLKRIVIDTWDCYRSLTIFLFGIYKMSIERWPPFN